MSTQPPKKTLFTILNEGGDKISPIYFDEHWVRIYAREFPIQEGSVVLVEGTFWIEHKYEVEEANADGLWKVRAYHQEGDTHTADLTRVQKKEVQAGQTIVYLPGEGSF